MKINKTAERLRQVTESFGWSHGLRLNAEASHRLFKLFQRELNSAVRGKGTKRKAVKRLEDLKKQ